MRGLPPAFQASAPMDRALQVRKQTMSGKSQKDGLEGVSAVIRTIEAVARHPHPYPRAAARSEAEGLPRPDRPSTRARTLPGEGRGFQGGGGPLAPHLLEVLYPLCAAPQRGSAMLRLVEDTHGAERGQGMRLNELRSAAKLIHELQGGTRADRFDCALRLRSHLPGGLPGGQAPQQCSAHRRAGARRRNKTRML